MDGKIFVVSIPLLGFPPRPLKKMLSMPGKEGEKGEGRDTEIDKERDIERGTHRQIGR